MSGVNQNIVMNSNNVHYVFKKLYSVHDADAIIRQLRINERNGARRRKFYRQENYGNNIKETGLL